MAVTDLSQYKNAGYGRFDNLHDWLAWQERLHFTAIELGLDRCRKVAEAMDLLPPSYYVISIAGTNGKGSCAVMLEQTLTRAGYRVGLYSSPHLLHYNERIRINGEPVGDRQICRSFAGIDLARESTTLTYFEFGTLAAMDIFRKEKVEIAIMEVGMGGRLDAVNMLDANVALISTIDIDHEKWLGNDRETIGREKSGIFRSMRPAVCADKKPPRSVDESADLVGANLLKSGRDFHHRISDDYWSWRSGTVLFEKLPIPAGLEYQVDNASGVLMVLQAISVHFPVGHDALVSMLSEFSMPGRFQTIPGKVPLILDVAHNRQSALNLAKNLRVRPVPGKTVIVMGMLKEKNHEAFMNALLPYVDAWFLAGMDDKRSASADELSDRLRAVSKDAEALLFENLEDALITAEKNTGTGDRIIVTGSFVSVGKALSMYGTVN